MANLVSDLINEAFLDLGAFAPGEGITTAEQTDAFMRLNQLIASWSTEQLTVPVMTHGSFTVIAGTRDYTMGVGGNFVTTARPLRITGASSVSGNFRQSVKVISYEKFAATIDDDLGSSTVLASTLAVDGSFPLLNLRVHPMPATAPAALWLDYWMIIAQFATVSDALTGIPPEFEHALHYNLAVALYPQYPRAGGIPPELASLAQNSKAAIVARMAAVLGQGATAPPPEAQ